MTLTQPGGVGARTRSFEGIADGDLRRLAILAQMDQEQFFAQHPRWRRQYGDRLIAVVLTQTAAAHYVDGTTGIKDFGVWSFYREHPDAPYPNRRKRVMPFGDPRFGRCLERPEFEGRPVDLVGRSIAGALMEDPAAAIRRYLQTDPSPVARRLRAHPVVMLEPGTRRGEVIWPAGQPRGASAGTGPDDGEGRARWRKP